MVVIRYLKMAFLVSLLSVASNHIFLVSARLSAAEKEDFTKAALNWVKIFPLQASPKDARNESTLVHLPSQVIFDFNKDVQVQEELFDGEQQSFKIRFSPVLAATFRDKKSALIKQLAGIPYVEKVSMDEESSKGSVAVSFFFKKDILQKNKDAQGVVVRLSRVEAPYNSRRIIVDIYPRKMLQELCRNERILRLAQNRQELVLVPVKKKVKTSPDASHFRVIIDAGHGGSDKGAVGHFALVEKEITLDIAQRIKAVLESDRIKVTLTRSTDKNLDLVERLGFAHQLQADAFVSIHANAHPKAMAYGLDAYYLDPSIASKGKVMFARPIDKERVRVHDAYVAQNSLASRELSKTILTTLKTETQKLGINLHCRGVKQEGFCVLLNSQIPLSVNPAKFVPVSLVEVGFLTDKGDAFRKGDAKMLADPNHRNVLANFISQGIKEFLMIRG